MPDTSTPEAKANLPKQKSQWMVFGSVIFTIIVALPLLYLAYAIGYNAHRWEQATRSQVSLPAATPIKVHLPDQTNSPVFIDAFHKIESACDPNLTSAQQQEGLEQVITYFHGKQIAMTGNIDNVRKTSNGYRAMVALEKVDTSVAIDLPKEQALSLDKQDYVLIKGEYTRYVCGIYGSMIGTLTPLN